MTLFQVRASPRDGTSCTIQKNYLSLYSSIGNRQSLLFAHQRIAGIPLPLSMEKNGNRKASWQRFRFKLNGVSYLPGTEDIHFAGNNGIYTDLQKFLKEWFDDSPTLTVHTSGSTGIPKRLVVRKEQMMNSARITCEFLQLHPDDKALLCMPLKYIAGKMMVVRALVAELDLIVREPSGHPLADIHEPLHFAAMIPLQVYNSLQVAEEKSRLENIETLIIGGGAIDKELAEAILPLPNQIYSTYGMTETLSHIALRRLNGAEASEYYHPFPSVRLSLSPEQTLVIDAPLVSDERLTTNDVADLRPDGSFVILGRKDNIVNSGGVKIQVESVENQLRSLIPVPFALTAVPHSKFGEALTLLIRQDMPDKDRLQCEIAQVLPKYQQPKYILFVDGIPLTETGKISRAECKRVALQKLKIEN